MIKKNYYRITKYNPKYRNEKGAYLLDEWTSFSDIGKVYNNAIFTAEEYSITERNYIYSLQLLIEENKIDKLMIDSLEKYLDHESLVALPLDERKVYKSLKNKTIIDIGQLESVVKLILREKLWCKLLSLDGNFEIEFGYDYYMYVKCESMPLHLREKFLSLGIYTENIVIKYY